MEHKEELINKLIKDNGYKSFLEIGVQTGYNIHRIECKVKHGVDPAKIFLKDIDIHEFYKMRSDDFFAGSHGLEEYDICFVDGLHHSDQILADIVNCMARLAKGGAIVVHDLLPESELEQRVPRESRSWTGDVWKTWYLLLKHNYKMHFETYHFDHGVGVISDIDTEAMDDLFCDYTSLLEDLKLVSYENDFEEYKQLIGA